MIDRDEWHVDEDDFPVAAPWEGRIRFLARYALLAPSNHNMQPWTIRIDDNVLDLIPDRARCAAVVDPTDRELVISCGAFLFHFRVAARHFGFDAQATLLPSAEPMHRRDLDVGEDVLARVVLQDGAARDERMEMLFAAIPTRRTNRGPYFDRPLARVQIDALVAAATAEGATLVPLEDEARKRDVAALVTEAERVQWSNPSFRRELAAWCHPNHTQSRDGMPAYAFGLGDVASLATPLVVRTFDLGGARGAHDEHLARGSPLLAVLATESDDDRAWLTAGQALDRVLLTAEASGVAVSFLNQPIEVPGTRGRLREVARAGGAPQILLRFGFARSLPAPTPRRPIDDVVRAHPLRERPS